MKKISRRQWIGFGIWATLYVLFCIWMENLWLLLGLFVLADIFLTRFVPWGAWKRSKNKHVREALEWVDDILFALIAVYFINLFVFQNYQIPTASLEKTLLVGDYLFVSKLSYGPRVPNTPLSFPLVQNTMPFFNCKSYLDWPHWGYKRVKGLGHVQRNDIVVFNLPTGDTVALLQQNPEDRTRILGPDHRDTLASRNNLAGAYQAAGRLDQAIPLLQQTLDDSARILGPHHPRTLTSRNNLAGAYQAAGRISEAIPLFEQALTDHTYILGPHHPDTLTSRNNLAGAYQAAGRLHEAIPLFEQTLTDCTYFLGPHHPRTLNTRNHLANAYLAVGRSEEARKLFGTP